MKKAAFTVAETLIVFAVIGTFIVLTVASTVNLGKLKEDKILNTSRAFYSSVLNSFREIILYESTDQSTITSAASDEEKLADLLIDYLGGEETSCDDKDFKALKDEKGEHCAFFQGGIYAKIYYNPKTPPDEVEKKDYYIKEDPTADEVSGAYGYITYTYKDSINAFGQDTFRIAFSRQRIK